MIFIYYPKCSTCRNAKKYLEEKKITFIERNIKTENPTYDELKQWYKLSKLPLKKFFNTSGILYKELNLKDKLKDMSEDEQLHLLSEDGMLVKRPMLINNDNILLGFKEQEYEEKIKG